MPINYKDYPPNWKKISAFIRFVRANNKCEQCGAENYKPNPVTGSKVVLTVAHIYDSNPYNCNGDNLKALCQLCHNRLDAKYRASNRKKNKQSSQMSLFEV